MPAPSRRRPKPTQQPTADGWTLVTRHSARHSSARTSTPSEETPLPSPPDPGTTLASLTAALARLSAAWLASPARASLHHHLLSISITPHTFVLLGLGSLSSSGPAAARRTAASLAQLAAAEDMLATLGRAEGRRVACDPVFNDLDKEMLAERGWEVVAEVEVEEGAEGVFLFAPHAPARATGPLLRKGVGVYVGNSVREEYLERREERWAEGWLAAREERGLAEEGRCAGLGSGEWAMYGVRVYWVREGEREEGVRAGDD